MVVRVVGFVGAYAFEGMCEVVGYEIHAHEEEKDRHSEASKDLGALEPERVPYTAPFPYFKVAEDVYHDTEHGTQRVEEDKMRERGEGERALGAPEDVGCDYHVPD